MRPVLWNQKNQEGHHRAWTDEERAQFEARWPVGTRERLAYTIALYTGQRRGDIASMTWENVRSFIEGEYLRVVQEKTGAQVDLPIAGLLRAFDGEDPEWLLDQEQSHRWASHKGVLWQLVQ